MTVSMSSKIDLCVLEGENRFVCVLVEGGGRQVI